jgi:hypothetical protein
MADYLKSQPWYNSQNMKLLFLFILTFLLTIKSPAQILKGVIQSKDGENISFASIYSISDAKSTLSNEDGEFSLNCQTPNSIIVSCLGYKTDTLLVSNGKSSLKITLKQQVFALREITVLPPSYAQRLLNTALETLYGQESNVSYANAFYRQITKNNNAVVALEEVFYKVKHSPRMLIGFEGEEARYAQINEEQQFPFSIIADNSYFLLARKLTGSKSATNSKNTKLLFFPSERSMMPFYEYNLEGIEDGVATIDCRLEKGFKQKYPYGFEGKITIDTTAKEITSVSFSNSSSLGVETKKGGFKRDTFAYSVEINTRSSENGRFIDNMKTRTTYKVRQRGQNTPIIIEVNNFLLLEKPVKDLGGNYETIKRTLDLQKLQNAPYNAEFWKKSNPIKYTIDEGEAIEVYNKSNYFGTYFEK